MSNENTWDSFWGWLCQRSYTEEEIHDIWDDGDNEIIIKETNGAYVDTPIMYNSRVIVDTKNHLAVAKTGCYEKINILLTYSRETDENYQCPVRCFKYGSIFIRNHEYKIDNITFEKSSSDSDNTIDRMICSYSKNKN
jgi:hypothetical protein